MAKYRPKSEIVIAEPCNESWEEMSGDSRVRHCAECDREVHNLAALTPSQIDSLIADPQNLPCMRIAKYADGTLLVADEQRQLAPFGLVAGAAMAALVTLSAGTASAQQNTMGSIVSVRNAVYSGRVVDSYGNASSGVTVSLSRTVNGNQQNLRVETDSKGEFSASVEPGDWQLNAVSKDGNSRGSTGPLHLRAGAQRAEQPITLRSVLITAGVPAIMPPQKPVQPPKK